MEISRAAKALSARSNLRRVLLTLLVLPVLLGASYCQRERPVPVALPAVAHKPVAVLLDQINSTAAINTIQARITLDFEDFAQASKGKKREIPTVNGLLVLQRPQNIRLVVEAPLFSLKIADMVSDGDQFRLALFWPESSRKFLLGSNKSLYGKIEGDVQSENPDIQRAGALANIRPQHLTDAILIRPIEPTADSIYFLEAATEIEPDTRPKAKRGAQVERPYYIVTLLERDPNGAAQLVRKFWFDRSTPAAPLSRQQIFDRGVMMTDVTYSEFFEVGGQRLPKRIFIRRRGDFYAVTVTLRPESVQLNNEVLPTAFVLNNEDQLPEVNLDLRLRDSAQPNKP